MGPSAAAYQIGVGTTDITPPVGGPLAGWAARGRHTSTGVDHPLRAVATAIDDGQTPVLLVSVEWVSLGGRAERIRDEIAGLTGIPTERIVLSGTHTHCGPAVGERDKASYGRIDEAYVDTAAQAIAAAASYAWQTRWPAVLSAGVGHCGIAMSRRAPDPSTPGRLTRMAPNPDGLTDHDVPVLAVTSPDNGTIHALLVSYACHLTSRATQRIGGDYVSYLYDDLEDTFPYAQPAFFQGCAGDQKVRPADPASSSFGNRSREQLRRAGTAVADAVTDVVAHRRLRPVSGPITTARSVIELHTEPVADADLRAALASDQPAYRQRWARQHLQTLGRGEQPNTSVPFEIQAITFGDSLAIIAMAGEMTVEHGLRLKRELAARYTHVLPLGYANDIVGYVPVRRQFDEYGYEVLDANQYRGYTGRYLPDTEDRIHAQIQEMLKP